MQFPKSINIHITGTIIWLAQKSTTAALADVTSCFYDLMCPVSYAGECFLQDGFKSDSEKIMKDLRKNDAGCQVTF
jgi:hypothetical protein